MGKKKGFSLVEILVSTVIFSLVMLGMASVFVAAKGHIIHARERMVSTEIGKFFIDRLQMEVKLENWSSGIFVLGVIPSASQTINNTGFTADYTLGTVANTDLYWVTTKISWTEPVL